MNWIDNAACKDSGAEMFYADSSDRATNIKKEIYAKNICRRCEVAAECLMYALKANEEYGIWGSFAPKERSFLLNAFSHSKIDIDLCRSVVNVEIKSIKAKMLRNEWR